MKLTKNTNCIVCMAAEREGDGADGALFVLAFQAPPHGPWGTRFLLNRMCKRHARTLRYWIRLLRGKWKKMEREPRGCKSRWRTSPAVRKRKT